MTNSEFTGNILIVSGPSGSGKTSLSKIICQELDYANLSISSTTRDMREGERDGVDYHFMNKNEFMDGIKREEFLEWAEVHDNFYGTSKLVVEKALREGKTILFDIDVQGHASIREQYPDLTTSVFVTTNSLTTLRERLVGRDTDSEEIIDKRLINAYGEMKHIKEYDYLILNEDFKDSLDALRSITISLNYKKDKILSEDFIREWKNK